MTSVPTASPRRRRRWPWVLAAFLLTPPAVLAVMAASFLTLDREAAALRSEVMASSDHDWNTKLQLSVGRVTLGCLRLGLLFVPHPKMAEARDALAIVQSVSVGIYRPAAARTTWSRARLFNEADRAMAARGWTRLVGVAETRENVLVYVPADDDELRGVCVAVATPRELVVVTANLDPEALVDFVARHAGRHLRWPPGRLKV